MHMAGSARLTPVKTELVGVAGAAPAHRERHRLTGIALTDGIANLSHPASHFVGKLFSAF